MRKPFAFQEARRHAIGIDVIAACRNQIAQMSDALGFRPPRAQRRQQRNHGVFRSRTCRSRQILVEMPARAQPLFDLHDHRLC